MFSFGDQHKLIFRTGYIFCLEQVLFTVVDFYRILSEVNHISLKKISDFSLYFCASVSSANLTLYSVERKSNEDCFIKKNKYA